MRKLFCDNAGCERRIFTERLPDLVAPWARKTTRLCRRLTTIAAALGGAAGARLSSTLGLPVARNTLLRLIRAAPLPSCPIPAVLGVDDWAYRKRHTYGSLLMDLEQRRPVTLLPDREADTLAQWLQDHPGVEVVTRDRAGAYAEGARRGAPQAVQVADRFHLLQNLAEALESAFSAHAMELRAVESVTPNPALQETLAPAPVHHEASARAEAAERRERRLARYQQVSSLRREGWSGAQIARQLGLGRRTVLRYLRHEGFPERQGRSDVGRSRLLDPWKSVILERWNGGCRHSRRLFHELQRQGYSGSYPTLARYAQRLRRAQVGTPLRPPSLKHRPPAVIDSPKRPLTPRSAARLVLRRADEHAVEETERLNRLRLQQGPLADAVALAEEFATLVRTRGPERLEPWLGRAQDSALPAFRNFAKKLDADVEAVRAAISLPWSNGPVEGQINRLKLLKRQMYGRANLDLLNRRFLLAALSPKVIKSSIQMQMTPGAADLTAPTGTRGQGSPPHWGLRTLPHCAPARIMWYHLATSSPPGEMSTPRTLLSCLGLGLAATALTGTHGLAGPLVASLAESTAGNLATDIFKALDRRAAERFLAGWSSIDENQHVERALRLAQINGLRAVLGRFDAARAGDPQIARQQEAERFSALLKRFLHREAKATQTPDFAQVSADEQAIRRKVLDALPEAFDQSLAARRATGDPSALLVSWAQLRAAVEAAVWEEIRSQTLAQGEAFPPVFEAAFTGTGFPEGWFDLFVRDAASKLKEGTEFERIWHAEQLALVKALAQAHTEVLGRIDRHTERTDTRTERMEQALADQTATIKELLALAQRGNVFQRAAEQGIPKAAVRAIVERAGGIGVAAEDLLVYLERWIDDVLAERARPTAEGLGFEAVRADAQRRFDAGHLDEASLAFMEALECEERSERERQEGRRRTRLRLLQEAVLFDKLALNGPAAAQKLRRMAAIAHPEDRDAQTNYLSDQAAAYYQQGDTRGDNSALLVAIAAYREALKERTRERVPLDWAMTQNNLGSALQILGARESGTARLEEAVGAYREALKEYTRERVPLQWAMTQNNLGSALATLGARESGTARLEEAVGAYREALKEYTRERVPLDWATTQNNLGSALARLGKRESGTARLEEAVGAYREALKERTRERVPLDWAMTQNNLGSALATLGKRESGTARLEEAVGAYREALKERTRERVPLQWAMTQNNLGSALQALGERESGTARLEEAVGAYREALKEYTRERVPLDWAMTQNNLGNALATLGERESGTARLEEAVGAYREALKEYTRERVPLQWAMTQNNFGSALQTLGGRESGTARLEEAVGAYREALKEYTRERVPLRWAMTQNNLGSALATLGARESGTARLEEAVGAYREALKERTRERVPLDWAMTQNNLGSALQTLGARESGTARLEEAVGAYREALKEYTRERVPLQWAMTQNNLGNALQALGERESGTARLEEAVGAYREALKERTRERVPLQWATTQNNLGNALATLGERESGTARLEEAVGAYREALKERTRERVPLDWAMTQNNLGNALQTLGARESGTARLEEAVGVYREALKERTRERVPLDWAMTQNNLGNALQTLGGRESGTARLEEAVAAYDAALTVFMRARADHYTSQCRANRHRVLARLTEQKG